MSATTKMNSASPPTMSNVSGEVAWSRVSEAVAATATFAPSFLGFDLGFDLGLAVSRLSARVSRRVWVAGGW